MKHLHHERLAITLTTLLFVFLSFKKYTIADLFFHSVFRIISAFLTVKKAWFPKGVFVIAKHHETILLK
ncbi:hypothetical protein [Virgibacillus ainsalahensis]